MLGAVYGDVIGSHYEVYGTKDYDFPFEADSTFTDDSVLTAAVCKTILDDPSEISRFDCTERSLQYAAHYRQFYSRFPYAGYGSMFAAWARDPYAKPNRSYGNGAAMRIVPIAYAYDDIKQMMLQVKASCYPTHNNPEAITAACAAAAAVRLALDGKTKEEIKKYIEKHFFDLSVPLARIKETHAFNSRASYSVPPAIIAFLESDDYESAVRNAVSLGGDADTQACIAGGIAEAYYKEIPDEIIRFCEGRIDITIKNTVRDFINKFVK